MSDIHGCYSVRQQIRFIAATNKYFGRKSLNKMESVHNMHNIKNERETVSALCHRCYLTAANGQIPIYLGSRNSVTESVR